MYGKKTPEIYRKK